MGIVLTRVYSAQEIKKEQLQPKELFHSKMVHIILMIECIMNSPKILKNIRGPISIHYRFYEVGATFKYFIEINDDLI